MRKKLNDLHEVAHYWANSVQPEGENQGGSFSFNGGILYSYATPIAVKLDNVTLFLNETFSVTTSKHQSYAQSAAHGHVLNVANLGVDNNYGWSSNSKSTMHNDNLTAYKQNIKELLVKATRARKYAEYHVRDAENNISAYNDYLALFKIRRKRISMDQFDVAGLLEKANKQKAKALKAKKLREEKLMRDSAEKIAQWKNGENVSIPWSVSKCFLRLNTEKDIIETSKGANIPASHTAKLWRLVKRCVNSKTAYTPDYNHKLKLGYYSLDSIRANGSIKVGCHSIDFDELARMSKVMGYA